MNGVKKYIPCVKETKSNEFALFRLNQLMPTIVVSIKVTSFRFSPSSSICLVVPFTVSCFVDRVRFEGRIGSDNPSASGSITGFSMIILRQLCVEEVPDDDRHVRVDAVSRRLSKLFVRRHARTDCRSSSCESLQRQLATAWMNVK